MDLIFQTKLNFFFYLFPLIVFVFLTIVTLKKYKDNLLKFITIIILRFLIVCSLFLIILEPVFISSEVNRRFEPVLCFIDNSFSMNNGIRTNNNLLSIKDYYIEQCQLINEQLTDSEKDYRFDFYSVNEKVSEINDLDNFRMSPQKFNLDNLLKLINQENSPFNRAVIISDWNSPFDVQMVTDIRKKLYVIMNNENTYDAAITDAKFICQNNKHSIIDVYVEVSPAVINSELNLTLYKKDQIIHQKSVLFTTGRIKVSFDVSERGLYRVELENQDVDINEKNNYMYVKGECKKDEKRNVYVIFGVPNYDSSFLMQYLNQREDIDAKIFYPKANSTYIDLPNLKSQDIVILGNIFKKNLNARLVNKLIEFVMKGGYLVFHSCDTNLKTILKSKIKNILPFYNVEKLKAGLQRENTILTVTNTGENYDFLIFRNRFTYTEIWNSLPIFKTPDYYFNLKKGSSVLAQINKIPAIIRQKIDRGEVITILVDPLWQIDFKSLAESYSQGYYIQFWEEILNRKYKTPVENVLMKSQKFQYNFNETIVLYFGSDFNEKFHKNFQITNGEDTIELNVERSHELGIYYCTFKSNLIGLNEVILFDKNTDKKVYAGNIFVKYPESENKSNSYDEKLKICKVLSENSGGLIINSKELIDIRKFIEPEYERFETIEKVYPTHQFYYYMMILLFFSLEWYIRRNIL